MDFFKRPWKRKLEPQPYGRLRYVDLVFRSVSVAAICFASLWPTDSCAENFECIAKALLASQEALHRDVRGVRVHRDAFEQFLQWEEKSNLALYRESVDPVDLKVSPVDSAKVEVFVSANTDEALKSKFIREGKVFVPKHPYNSAVEVPFHSEPTTEIWPGRFTASRSVVVMEPNSSAFSVKIGTNYPHRTERQSKVDLDRDILGANIRTPYLDRVDREIGGDSRLIVLREVLTVQDKTTKNGIVVRDLHPLQDGNYYFPAFSIPYVGRDIANANGTPFVEFWDRSYAELLGRSKARLLLRYGLQMVSPNMQNMLIQFDRQLRPTGTLVFRDISDSVLVEALAKGLQESDELGRNKALTVKVAQKLELMTDNSLWRLDEALDLSVDVITTDMWAKTHNRSYINEIVSTLGLDQAIKTVSEMEGALFSPNGAEILRNYRAKLKGHK